MEDFDILSKDILLDFYHNNYRNKLRAVFIGGKLTSEHESAIKNMIEELNFNYSNINNPSEIKLLNPKTTYINKKDSSSHNNDINNKKI